MNKYEWAVDFVCNSPEIDKVIKDMFDNWIKYYNRPIHTYEDMKNHYVLEALTYFNKNKDKLVEKDQSWIRNIAWRILWNQFRSKNSNFSRIYRSTYELKGDNLVYDDWVKEDLPSIERIQAALAKRKGDFKSWLLSNMIFEEYYLNGKKYSEISSIYKVTTRTLMSYNKKTIQYLKEYFERNPK